MQNESRRTPLAKVAHSPMMTLLSAVAPDRGLPSAGRDGLKRYDAISVDKQCLVEVVHGRANMPRNEQENVANRGPPRGHALHHKVLFAGSLRNQVGPSDDRARRNTIVR